MSNDVIIKNKQHVNRWIATEAEDQLKAALPAHLKAGTFIRLALVDMRQNPKLAECSPESVISSIMDAARLGLTPGPLGHSHLVPYWNSKMKGFECQLVPGYQGIIELVRRSGDVARIEAHVVHEQDDFDVQFGTESRVHHRPCWNDDPGPVVGAYAVCYLKDGSFQFDFMTRAEIDAIRERSKAKFGPWVTDYAEMAKKTVLKRAAKYWPMSTEAAEAISIDHNATGYTHIGKPIESIPAEAQEVTSMAGTRPIEPERLDAPAPGDVDEPPEVNQDVMDSYTNDKKL